MQARIVNKNGFNAVEINGQVYEYIGYRSWRPENQYLKAFDDMRFPFMTLLPSGIKNAFGIPYSAFGEYWKGEGEYDWDILRRQIDQFVENAPHAYLAINLMLDTRDWFLRDHPDCPNSFIYISAACTYKPWRACAERMLRDTLDFLMREYPEKVFAIFLSAGGTCEWHNKRDDIPACAVRDAHYRAWIGNPDAEIPTKEDITRSGIGMFRDPVKQKNTLDFLRYSNDLITEELAHYARLVKRHTDGKLLVGAAAGYIMGGSVPQSGHCGAADVLRIPEIDIIVCPASYAHRSLDGVSASQTGMDAVRLNGKLMVHSIDNTTYAANRNPYAQMLQNSHCVHDSMEESINYIRRETAMAMAKGAGFWFFDMYAGWYPDEASRRELLRVKQAYEKIRSAPGHATAQVAVLTDTRSWLHAAQGGLANTENVVELVDAAGRIGAPVDYLSVYDLLLPDFPQDQYKLMILPNVFAPTPEVREAVRKLREKGVSFLFYHAAGAISDAGIDWDAASEFCGIRIRVDDEKAGCTVVDGEHNCLGYPRIYGNPRKSSVEPVLYAEDEACEVWGKDMYSEKPQLVLKRRNGGFDAWTYRGSMHPAILRRIVMEAGVFLYQEAGLPTYANSRMAAFFDHRGGEREITFPCKGKITEFYAGREWVSDGTPLKITFAPNECKLFIYEE